MKKYLKLSLLGLFTAVAFTSCLKSREDAGGILDDKGGIVTTIGESAYLNTDAQNVGFGFTAWANVNLLTTSRPTEAVKFFTLHVAQNKDVKVSGSMIVTVKMTDIGTDALPAGAISFNPNITVPAFDGISLDVPVYYTINKSAFTATDPTLSGEYGINFEITGVTQGIYSELEKSVDVGLNGNFTDIRNNTDIIGRYKWNYVVSDPTGQIIFNGSKWISLVNDGTPALPGAHVQDNMLNAFGYPGQTYIFAARQLDGRQIALLSPRYTFDATGKVTGIANTGAAAGSTFTSPSLEVIGSTRVTNLALDPTGDNKFTFSANDNRVMKVRYSFTLTYPINGVDVARTMKVDETYTYDYIQAYY